MIRMGSAALTASHNDVATASLIQMKFAIMGMGSGQRPATIMQSERVSGSVIVTVDNYCSAFVQGTEVGFGSSGLNPTPTHFPPFLMLVDWSWRLTRPT